MILQECYWQSCAVKMLAVTTADWCVPGIMMTRWNYSRPGTVRFSCLKPSPAQSERPCFCEGQLWLMNDDNLVCVNEDNATLTLSACLSSIFIFLFQSQAGDPRLKSPYVDHNSLSYTLKNFSEGSVIEGMSQRTRKNVFQVQLLIFMKL